MISTKDVDHIANLARIEISPQDKAKITGQLSVILDYVEELSKAPTDEVAPIKQISGLKNISRQDEIEKSLAVEKVLSNAPEKENNFFKTKAVFWIKSHTNVTNLYLCTNKKYMYICNKFVLFVWPLVGIHGRSSLSWVKF